MSITAIMVGTASRSPEIKKSKNGNDYCLGTMRVKDGNSHQYWRITAFGREAIADLMQVGDGDAISVSGFPKIELYQTREGEKRLSLSLVVEKVITVRMPSREKPPRPDNFRTPVKKFGTLLVADSHGLEGFVDAELNDSTGL